MDFDELEEWVSERRDEGFSDQEIRSHLRDEGFSDQDIEQALRDLDNGEVSDPKFGDDNYGREQERESQNYGKSGRKNSKKKKSVDEKNNKSVKDFSIESAFGKGLSFFKSDGAKQSFLYLFGASFLLALMTVGINIVEQSGPILGFLGSTPLSLGLLFGLILLGIAYVKFFRIILSEVDVELQSMSTLGSFLALLRIGFGYVFYVLAVVAGLLLFILPGIYLAQRLFFFNYGVMQGYGLIHSFKKSWGITEGRVIKVLGLTFTASILSGALSLVFEVPAELLNIIGYPNLSIMVSTPGSTISSMATVAILGAAYGMLIRTADSQN